MIAARICGGNMAVAKPKSQKAIHRTMHMHSNPISKPMTKPYAPTPNAATCPYCRRLGMPDSVLPFKRPPGMLFCLDCHVSWHGPDAYG